MKGQVWSGESKVENCTNMEKDCIELKLSNINVSQVCVKANQRIWLKLSQYLNFF